MSCHSLNSDSSNTAKDATVDTARQLNTQKWQLETCYNNNSTAGSSGGSSSCREDGSAGEQERWARRKKSGHRSRLTISIIEKGNHGQQGRVKRSSSSAGGFLRTSISAPRLPQHHSSMSERDKHKLRTSVSTSRLPQHSAPPPPAPAQTAAPPAAIITLQTQKQHSHSLDELHHPGRQILLWVYTDTTKLYLFPALRTDPISSVHDFLNRTHKFTPSAYELAILTPGLLYPILLQNFKAELYSGILLCLPSNDIILAIQTQDREQFTTVANPLDNIEDIKCRIQEQRGYPIVVQDLMLNGHVLRNDESVIDYQMSSDTRLFLIVQPCRKFAIQVDTFWGVKYSIEVGSCTTVQEIIQLILRKTMRTEEEATDFHARIFMQDKVMYEGLINLETPTASMKEGLCLGSYKVGKGASLRLTSTGEGQKDNCRMVQVLLENGVTVHTNAAKYDNWYVVALKLHGITGKPVDTMRLYVNDYPIELNCTVGTLKQNNDITYAKLATLRLSNAMGNNSQGNPSTLTSKLHIEVKTVNGILETVQCNPRDTIQDIKLQLQNSGVPEARYCDVLYKKVKLPGNSKLTDYKLQDRAQMELKMGEFPVKVICATNTVKLIAQSEQPISDLLAKIEAKTGASPIKAAITFGGRNLYEVADMVIQESALYVHSTIYVEPLQISRVLHLVTSEDVVPIPIRPNIDSLHLHQLTHLHQHPEMFLKSLHWFIRWRFPSRSGHHSVRSARSEPPSIPSKQRTVSEGAMISRSMLGALSISKPRRILDQRSRTMPVLNVTPHSSHSNHPHRQSFDLNDLSHSLRESSRSIVHIRESSLNRRDRSLDRLTSVVNIRGNTPERRERSLDRAHERGTSLLPMQANPSADRPAGVTIFLPNSMQSYSEDRSSSRTPSSSSSSPTSIKSAIGNSILHNGWPSRSESFPRRTARQLPLLPNDMSPGSTPDSTPASKKKLQVRFDLSSENGHTGDEKSPAPVRSVLKKGHKLHSSSKSAPHYGMKITRAHSVGSVDSNNTTQPQWNNFQRSKTVVDYSTSPNAN